MEAEEGADPLVAHRDWRGNAIAAPTLHRANLITTLANLNITCVSDPQKESMTLPDLPAAMTAIAKMTEKATTLEHVVPGQGVREARREDAGGASRRG